MVEANKQELSSTRLINNENKICHQIGICFDKRNESIKWFVYYGTKDNTIKCIKKESIEKYTKETGPTLHLGFMLCIYDVYRRILVYKTVT